MIKTPRGFTLIEMLVSTAIFTVVMVIALGSLLSMSESDRKAQTLKAVINNLNFSLDSMSRALRTGTTYGCGVGGDCPSGGTSVSFTPATGGSKVIYNFEQSNATLCGQPNGTVGCITRSIDGGTTYAPITSPEVIVTNLKFYVIGTLVGSVSSGGDSVQPKVTILVSGYVQFKGAGGAAACTAGSSSVGASTCFNLQTSVTQRLYDQ
jgi:prepilin-type N-terminal cleavage/methylation domain-containing protein